jgi:hypothetical protein
MRFTGSWSGGLAEWTEGDTAFISIAFTWRMPDAFSRAAWWRQQGYRVRAGGPAVFMHPTYLAEVAELPGRAEGDLPDAVAHHNPMATFASRGCPLNCAFCFVPKMQGRTFTFLPDFEPRPVLCDNNLSALPGEYQDHIVARYRAAGVPLLDANSGFEPRTFSDEVLARWRPINRGPWRFGYDDQNDRPHVARVMRMLKDVSPRLTRPYVMIGNEPMESCLDRIQEVLAWGGEPHVQPEIKLRALVKRPWVRHDWTELALRDVARWANRRLWRYTDFAGYQRSARTGRMAAA